MNGKYLNAKVRCVDVGPHDYWYTAGEIYAVTDGVLTTNRDVSVFERKPVKTFDEINNRLSAQFELVEDGLINATLTTGKKERLNKMTTDNFNAIISAQIDHCESILCSKAKEYATADRLHNFKVAGALQGISPVQALMGMMTKHTVSVADMCMSGEEYPRGLWDEKITDSINYLLLLSALVREKCDERK